MNFIKNFRTIINRFMLRGFHEVDEQGWRGFILMCNVSNRNTSSTYLERKFPTYIQSYDERNNFNLEVCKTFLCSGASTLLS